MTDALLSVAAGLALAAACGFRVFVPVLVTGIAARYGWVALQPGTTWLATTPALVALTTATVVEAAAFFVPWLDHALDTVASPLAVVAGVLLASATLVDLPPWLRWGVALVAGGGAAAAVQGSSVVARVASGALTGGLANPVVALGELLAAMVLAVLAVAVPVAALAVTVVVLVMILRRAARAPAPRGAT